ncbi:MAG: alanine--tRNA ligase [Candidatus Nealsonbacteria bacterium CG08_land_8_20_14_0_20_38_20]|uniref:alanine--tRNA ligase n=1 Tax=Candidatus Nealsonbacteria bacterium CG08_land_8_20_14_0_20_38_20 TaxID=1974705 RepID=A0A2H0YMQ7_9BACT|nr:MAG: alanine--tRNA ligase [Candidatus Nealsonbacteria bacterium CG08_land_8_20_14_0_20_38_20]
MTAKELRERFLNFFKKKGHKIVPSSSLIPTDPSVLFTTAGMQQFKECYLFGNLQNSQIKTRFLGKPFPYGKRAASCQKCLRTSDIEAVGDESHLTFLEMLGNFSFGDYFKEEAIKFAFQFLFEELELPQKNVVFTVFEGDKNVPEDKESILIWKKLGIKENKIEKRGREDNFWGPTGEEGPCGPTTEIHFQGTEVWNLVFNEYYQDRTGKLTPLKQKGVDTGMGLERLAMIVQGKPNVFETDLFEAIIKDLRFKIKDLRNEKAVRIIADHIKSAVFLISEGIFPSNVERGYILRRLLRRAIRFGKLPNLPKNFLIPLAQKVVAIYRNVYPEVRDKETDILTIIQQEGEKFEKTLVKGLKELNKLERIGKIEKIETSGELKVFNRVNAKDAFDIYQSYGFPLEMIQEELAKRGLLVDEKKFKKEFKKHQEISKAGAEKKFGGVGKEANYESAKLHTATHLLHAALRKILGNYVKQMGSDITSQRLRFDFSQAKKLTPEEIKKVEDLVNQKIKENLEVKKEETTYEEAIKSGALAFFKEKYPEKVTVYTVGGPVAPSGQVFSKEICAGPHVKKTSELGNFKIIKEESSGAGIRRIRAVLK